MADVIPASDVAAGIGAALERIHPELVVIADGRVAVEEAACLALAEQAFARFPQVAVLGGALADPLRRRWTFGYRLAGGATRAEPLYRAFEGEPPIPVPIDAAIPEYLIVRRSAAARALGRRTLHGAWNVELCRRVASSGSLVLHVPSLEVQERTSPVAAPAGA
jgi:hypothetical protein